MPGLTFEPRMMKALQRIALRHMEKQVTDPELRAKLTPSYVMGCKRILPSNDWYPALQQPNVELVTDGIREIRPEGIVTADGRKHEVDTIVLATGFKVTDISLAHRIRDADGVSMADDLAGQPAGLSRHVGDRVSRTCSSSPAPTPASATTRCCS